MAGNGSTGILSCLVEMSNQFSLITRKITTNLPSTGTFQGTKILLVGVFNSIASENPREHSLFQLAIANTSAGAAVSKNLVLVSPKVLLLAKWPCSHCHSSCWQQSRDDAGAPRCAACLQAQGFPGTHGWASPFCSMTYFPLPLMNLWLRTGQDPPGVVLGSMHVAPTKEFLGWHWFRLGEKLAPASPRDCPL